MTVSISGLSQRAADRIPQEAIAVVLAMLGIIQLAYQDVIHVFEAWAVSLLTGPLLGLPGQLVGSEPVFRYGGGDQVVHVMRVTSDCSAAPILAVLCLSAALLLTGRVNVVGRVIGALTAATALFMVVNTVRLLVIAWAYMRYGYEGFRVTHVYLGSIASLGGLIFSSALFLGLAGIWTPRWPRRRNPGPDAPTWPGPDRSTIPTELDWLDA